MGAWQGFWVTRIGVSSFIVTLAGMLYFRGLSMIITNGATVAPLPESLTVIATGFLPRPRPSRCCWPRSALSGAARLRIRRAAKLGVSSVMPHRARALPRPSLALTGIAVWLASWQGHSLSGPAGRLLRLAAELVMRRTQFGAQLYAIGGNPEAARLSGIDLKRVISGISSSPASPMASPASR